MGNPWLQNPASDYEGHMSSPHIAQQQFLAQLFRESLLKYDSTSIALIGCTTGNGLEFINSEKTQKVTAIDINPEYLSILRQRYMNKVVGLEITEADLETFCLEKSIYSLVFAGLVFEYIDPQILLPKISDGLCKNGVLLSILQLPSHNISKVSESSYESLKLLAPFMNLVDPVEFSKIAINSGLSEMESKIMTLQSGKQFFIGSYTK
jgi:SAM-dependent methyltransferase